MDVIEPALEGEVRHAELLARGGDVAPERVRGADVQVGAGLGLSGPPSARSPQAQDSTSSSQRGGRRADEQAGGGMPPPVGGPAILD
eukprot:802863-Pyramimonas_sp.AAC.1